MNKLINGCKSYKHTNGKPTGKALGPISYYLMTTGGAYLTSGFWAPMVLFVFTTKFSIVNINQDAVFLDLGANLGIYSLLAAQLRHSANDHRCFHTLPVSYHWIR